MRKIISMAVAIAAGLGLAGAAATGALAAEKLKVAWVYIGPVGDFGWTYQHDQGRKAVEKEFGDKVETTYVENVPEGPDAERVIEQLARAGNKLIFTTSFGYMEPTLKVAKRNPKVFFEHATGYKRDKNVSTYNSKFHEGRYILGQIAAKTSKTGTIGYIASFPIPEVISGINALMLGAQSVNPDIKVKIVWANSWFDPAKEADAAKALIDQGADVISQHTDSPAAMQAAEQRGVKAFGQASDMINFGPHAQLTSIVDNWAPYYIERVKEVMDGTWKSTDTWSGMKDGEVVMAPYTNMPDDVKAFAQATEAKIKSGELNPFKGPIYDQSGKLVVKEGDVLPDKDILSMNWYVKGIDDKVPGK
ncbi:simple sugar transport system substrate-binding protein [Angulomicrobium tetraedrale]|uniref:Simple sugar transport system substrate-binding protein n=1 Tax=Ancylobacter tetraedralis TaxID=217068 RepID=A0A839ZEE1_9HYPH|nr:BMP family ABC transporter substrate-binding protein [Ancylobacter tetraedralis]MBB3773027.1 simple sugar transport system substrate-binding protein [Ancylobacter tetraedralis]